MALTVGVPRWEVANGTVQLEATVGTWGGGGGLQVGNNQRKVWKNLDWFRTLTALFHLLPDMMTMLYSTGCLFVQLLIIMLEQHVNFYFQSILGIFIFYSTFLKVEKQKNSFCFSTSPGHVICFPHLHLLKLWEAWELPLSVQFVYVALPLEGKSNGMDYFGLWEGLPSPCRGYGKQPYYNFQSSFFCTIHNGLTCESIFRYWYVDFVSKIY